MATRSREMMPVSTGGGTPVDGSACNARRADAAATRSASTLQRRTFVKRSGGTALLAMSGVVLPMIDAEAERMEDLPREIALQAPDQDGRLTLEATLATRRSVREYSDGPLTWAEISQLLWAGQGVTNRAGYRTAPSAGALYPLELHVAIGRVESLPSGVYRYRPASHTLEIVGPADRRSEISRAALSQTWIADSAVVVGVAGMSRRITGKYGERGIRYMYMEAGHVAQNICLQAVALGLAVTPVGAFRDDEIRRILEMGSEMDPIYLLPIGRR